MPKREKISLRGGWLAEIYFYDFYSHILILNLFIFQFDSFVFVATNVTGRQVLCADTKIMPPNNKQNNIVIQFFEKFILFFTSKNSARYPPLSDVFSLFGIKRVLGPI